MQCASCGNELSARDAYCSACGAVTPYGIANSGISPNELTAASSSSGTPLQTASPPSTDYGSSPYGIPEQDAYQPLNPYDLYSAPTVPPPPPPPVPLSPRPPVSPSLPPPRRRTSVGLIVGVVVLVLVLVGVSAFAWLAYATRNNSQVTTTTPTGAATQTNPTATPVSTPTSTNNGEKNPYSPFTGTLVLNDPLSDNSMGFSWQESNDSNGSCGFTGGAYHVTTGAGHFYPCTASNTDYSNFAYEVQMKIIKGACGALLFRIDSTVTKYYYFRVCQDGSYALFIYNTTGTNLLYSPSSSAVHAGLNQSNVVAVVAQGSTFDFYINQQKVDNTADSTYSHGAIGLVADGFPNNSPAEVVYSNAKVWKL